jgi:hypothetical protein
MAEVDSIRVFRGIYSGLALAMSETEESLDFAALPSSDDIAHNAFQLAGQVIGNDERPAMRGARQELIGMAAVLAVLEHGGGRSGLSVEDLDDALTALARVIGWAEWPAEQP